MQLKICRITDVEDLKYLAPIEFKAFVDDEGHNGMLGANNPQSIAATIERQKKEFTSDAAVFWIKVVDADANNRIVAASEWKIYPSHVQADFDKTARDLDELDPKSLSWLGDEKQREDGVVAMQGFVKARFRNATEAYIALHLLFVDPEYHRKGAGRLMVRWGNRLADTMMLPAWVEASKQGRGLYASEGYEVVENVRLGTKHQSIPDIEYPLMRRPIQVSSITM